VAAADSTVARAGQVTATAHAKASAWLWGTLALSAGAFALAVAFAPAAGAAPGRGLAWVLFVTSSGHVASTGWLYGLRDVRAHVAGHRWRYLWVPAILLAAMAVIAVALPPGDMAWLLLPYFCWQFFHFQKQNLGMAALAATASGARSLTRGERRAILAAGWAGIGGLLAHPGLLQLAVNPGLGAIFPACGIAFGIAVAAGLALFLRRPRSARPLALAAAYSMALAFVLPVFAFASPYAAVGGLTIAHGAQYLLLISLVAGSGRGTARALRLALLANVVVFGGAALAMASHLHGSAGIVRGLYGAYLGAVMGHFVVDAGLWRLRDPSSRDFLARRAPYLFRATIDRVPI
jgi:hypothetical protein